MVFSGKEGIQCIGIFLFSSTEWAPRYWIIICISNHEFLLSKCLQMPYNKHFINHDCSVCTEKYRTSVFNAFLYKPLSTGSVCTKNTSVQYFSVKTSRKKLLTRPWINYRLNGCLNIVSIRSLTNWHKRYQSVPAKRSDAVKTGKKPNRSESDKMSQQKEGKQLGHIVG
jgi:hypothetical protein